MFELVDFHARILLVCDLGGLAIPIHAGCGLPFCERDLFTLFAVIIFIETIFIAQWVWQRPEVLHHGSQGMPGHPQKILCLKDIIALHYKENNYHL